MSIEPAGPRPARRATIIDVAERAGVSRQTVTRAMNGMDGISAATRDRVLAAAAELAYRPSRSGRALVRSEAPVIGLLVTDLTNAFFSELATAMIREAARHGWSVIFAEGGANAPEVQRLGDRVDVLVGYMPISDYLPANVAVPVVVLDAGADVDPRLGRIRLDLAPALADLVAHCRAVGVRSPAILDATSGGPSGRALLLRESLAQLGGGEVPLVVTDDRVPREELGAELERGLARLLDRAPEEAPIDLVVAFNDRVAVEALRILRERGIRVPDELRVIGIDGLALGTLVTPSLTTLGTDARVIARHAVELAIGIYEHRIPADGGADGSATLRRHDYRLIVRESG